MGTEAGVEGQTRLWHCPGVSLAPSQAEGIR